MSLPTNCPNCSFNLAPIVYLPANGNQCNALHCMNCGWSVEITAEDAARLNSATEDVYLNDHQWQILLEFMSYFIAPRSSGVDYFKLQEKINQELAAIYVRSSNPPQLSMPSVPEGPHNDNNLPNSEGPT